MIYPLNISVFVHKKTAKYWETLKFYYLALNLRRLSIMENFVNSEMLYFLSYCIIINILKLWQQR